MGVGEKYVHYGSKLPLIHQKLESLKEKGYLVVMFTDAYDILIFDNEQQILKTFKSFDARIVFGAEYYCNPVKSIAERFPILEEGQKRFLNSGGYIGYLKDVYAIIAHIIENQKIKPHDSDQFHFQRVYLNETLRQNHKIQLDHSSKLFFNIYGSAEEAEFHCLQGTLR